MTPSFLSTPTGRPRSAGCARAESWCRSSGWTTTPTPVGVTSSTGIETTASVAAAVEARGASPRGFLGYALIGLLVGVIPVALGLAWLPSLRRADPRWVAAFMALTAGLLSFLALDALAEALDLQARLPSGLQGPGLILLGVAASYLGLTFVAQRFSARGNRDRSAPLEGVALATLVAIGIGLHNLGEGLAIGSSIAIGELALGTFLIIGFMVHNVTEGLGIAAPIAGGERVNGLAARCARARCRCSGDPRRLDRRLPHERRARRVLLRARRRRRAAGRRRSRPLRRASSSGRTAFGARRRGLSRRHRRHVHDGAPGRIDMAARENPAASTGANAQVRPSSRT